MMWEETDVSSLLVDRYRARTALSVRSHVWNGTLKCTSLKPEMVMRVAMRNVSERGWDGNKSFSFTTTVEGGRSRVYVGMSSGRSEKMNQRPHLISCIRQNVWIRNEDL